MGPERRMRQRQAAYYRVRVRLEHWILRTGGRGEGSSKATYFLACIVVGGFQGKSVGVQG